MNKVEDLNGKAIMTAKAARVNVRLTIAEAAKLLGISVYKLEQIEFGKNFKDAERAKLEKAMCSVYKRNIGEIIFS